MLSHWLVKMITRFIFRTITVNGKQARLLMEIALLRSDALSPCVASFLFTIKTFVKHLLWKDSLPIASYNKTFYVLSRKRGATFSTGSFSNVLADLDSLDLFRLFVSMYWRQKSISSQEQRNYPRHLFLCYAHYKKAFGCNQWPISHKRDKDTKCIHLAYTFTLYY